MFAFWMGNVLRLLSFAFLIFFETQFGVVSCCCCSLYFIFSNQKHPPKLLYNIMLMNRIIIQHITMIFSCFYCLMSLITFLTFFKINSIEIIAEESLFHLVVFQVMHHITNTENVYKLYCALMRWLFFHLYLPRRLLLMITIVVLRI